MTKLSIALVVAASLAACKNNKSAGASGDCAAVVDRVVDKQVRGGMAKGAGGADTPEVKAELERMATEMDRMSKPVKAALTKACTDDKWSAEALACLRSATAIEACDSKLTAEQREHAEKVTADAMMSAAPKGDAVCTRYADLEIKCADAGEEARPVILDFCAKARAGAKDATYQLIRLESTCAETPTDCDAYKACVEKKKRETTPE